MVHHHLSHEPQLDIDAIPMLQDELPLLYRDDHMHLLPRRKRHSSSEMTGSIATASITNFVRRRGRSVPCDTRNDMSANDTTTSNSGTSTATNHNDNYDSNSAAPFVRRRAGSAAAALSGRTRIGSSVTAALTERRRAASSVLRHLRKRSDDHERTVRVASPLSQSQQRAQRRVRFKTTLHPEVMTSTSSSNTLASYDELLFNVGGLYQTLTFLHDPEPLGDDGTTDSSSNNSSSSSQVASLDADALPPERSMQLMIAEFLYRAAVYLGYPLESKPWLPGFRETKLFSVNDVKRWRRLAHFDWAALEAQQQHEQHTRMRQLSSASATTNSSVRGGRLRAAVSSWLHRRRRHSAPAKMTRAMNSPPPVPTSTDVSLLVTIANSCVYCGAFQFSARDIRTLCNVDIEAKEAAAA